MRTQSNDATAANTPHRRALIQLKQICARCLAAKPSRTKISIKQRLTEIEVEWPPRPNAAVEVVDFEEQRIVSLALHETEVAELPPAVESPVAPSSVPWRRKPVLAFSAAAVVLVGAAAVLTYVEMRQTPNGSVPAPLTRPETAGRSRPAGIIASTSGHFAKVIVSGPANSGVWMDGTFRGRTPLELMNVSSGPHDLEIRGSFGSVRQRITLDANITMSVLVPSTLPPRSVTSPAAARDRKPRETLGVANRRGWIRVPLPIPVRIFDGETFIGTNDLDRLPINAGSHALRLVNDSLKFHVTQNITVSPGESLTVTSNLPTGVLSVNAVPWAHVIIDGRDVGDTPIGNIPVPIGPHELTFRHPRLGEQRRTIVIVAGQTSRVSVSLGGD